ncbi:MAG: hypothetical protein SGI77_10330 [Pirellulaceae bacterium]|nr:hypothetical protein [Pirellulaceae bacterium]
MTIDEKIFEFILKVADIFLRLSTVFIVAFYSICIGIASAPFLIKTVPRIPRFVFETGAFIVGILIEIPFAIWSVLVWAVTHPLEVFLSVVASFVLPVVFKVLIRCIQVFSGDQYGLPDEPQKILRGSRLKASNSVKQRLDRNQGARKTHSHPPRNVYRGSRLRNKNNVPQFPNASSTQNAIWTSLNPMSWFTHVRTLFSTIPKSNVAPSRKSRRSKRSI